jgi:hypothetical protein
MGSYSWQAVVLEKRNSVVTHYGKRGPLASPNLGLAKREVEEINALSVCEGGNCYLILDRAGQVVASRIKDPETGNTRWA